MTRFFWILLVGLLCFRVEAQNKDDDWTDVTRDAVDSRYLSPMGEKVLNDPHFKWQHAQSTHFVIHYERKAFAVKVARQAEFFYQFIGSDLKSASDRAESRSHIFIFRDEKDWKYFMEAYPVVSDWTFSYTLGMSLYLQQAETTSGSAGVLAHEMTHLVFNRYYTGRMPLWLNEGTAEWYSEFAYAAFKGIKKSKRQVFRRIRDVYPVEQLLTATAYPSDTGAVHVFYETSKFLVGYLQLNYPQERFDPFLAAMVGGASLDDALRDQYGIQSVAELNASFQKFVH